MPEDKSVEIFFRFFSDILEEETTEALLAEVENGEYGYYKISSLPFYTPKIASGDIVWAEYNDAEGMLTYRKTIQHSGNSIIHAIIMDDMYNIDDTCNIFMQMECRTAQLNFRYFAVEIPAGVDYFPIKRRLDELAKEGVLDYAESGLSEKHQYKNISFQ